MPFNLIFNNKKNSSIISEIERLSFHPSLIIADSAKFDSPFANDIAQYILYEIYNDELLLRLASTYFKEKKPENAASLLLFADSLKSLSKVKHKDKKMVIMINRYKTVAKKMKEMLKNETKNYLIAHNLFELLDFTDNEILRLRPINFFEDDGKENYYIKEILDELHEPDNFYCFDINIEKLFKFSYLESPANEQFDFIKIPMWIFPSFAEITFDKMKYTRQDFAPTLTLFRKQLIELNTQLREISFSKDAYNMIKQLCTEKIKHHISPIQTKIDESLFMMQQKNKYPNLPHLKFHLAISSTQTLIDYYDKTGVLHPYVANEIKQQFCRHADITRTCVFAYYDIIN